jgi:cbb3-type cytochrome c oxidase subunit III
MTRPETPAPAPKDPGTTGHEWDGIRELNNPLPRWWLWTFWITIVWGLAYTVAYPAWPLLSGATPGLTGFSTRGDVASAITAAEAQNAGLDARLASADPATMGLPSFAPTVPSAMVPGLPGQRVTRTCWMTTGFGAALSAISSLP